MPAQRVHSVSMSLAEPAADSLLTDGSVMAALRELREAGGQKRPLSCGFGFDILNRLVQAGFVTLDGGPGRTAMVRITSRGRLAYISSFYS